MHTHKNTHTPTHTHERAHRKTHITSLVIKSINYKHSCPCEAPYHSQTGTQQGSYYFISPHHHLSVSFSQSLVTHAHTCFQIYTCWINKCYLISQRQIAGHRLKSSSLGTRRDVLARSRTDQRAW